MMFFVRVALAWFVSRAMTDQRIRKSAMAQQLRVAEERNQTHASLARKVDSVGHSTNQGDDTDETVWPRTSQGRKCCEHTHDNRKPGTVAQHHCRQNESNHVTR